MNRYFLVVLLIMLAQTSLIIVALWQWSVEIKPKRWNKVFIIILKVERGEYKQGISLG